MSKALRLRRTVCNVVVSVEQCLTVNAVYAYGDRRCRATLVTRFAATVDADGNVDIIERRNVACNATANQMIKNYIELNKIRKELMENKSYEGFGAFISTGDIWNTQELYDELDEDFHNQVSSELFKEWIEDYVLFLYDEDGNEVELFLSLLYGDEIMITDIAYC